MFKCSKGQAPLYLIEKFKKCGETHNYKTRGSVHADLQLPFPRCEQFKRSLRYSGANIWNSLPLTVKQASTLYGFKKAYKSAFNC